MTMQRPLVLADPATDDTRKNPALGWIDRTLRTTLARVAADLQHGQLTVFDELGQLELGRPGPDFPEPVVLRVHDLAFYRMLALSGSVGLGEAYALGLWSANDLGALARLFARNVATLSKLESGISRVTRPANKLLHRLNRNTLRGSKRNIAAHYDVGNDFYRLFLDETLTYSSGIFPHEISSLREASIHKIDRVCKKLRLQPSDHLLEIGTGWGALAIHAAKHYGCRVTTTTISQEQHRVALERVAAEGLQDRITVLLEDYRNLSGRYDKLVSIEMIEAVGHEYFDAFFNVIQDCLAPDGLALIQAITTPDHRYERAKDSVDFIKRTIFPGSCLPSTARLLDSTARLTQLRLVHLEDITPHYARTLELWRKNLMSNQARVRAQGYSDSFLRLWEWYLAYCEGGFAERYIGNVQLVFEGAAGRHEPLLGDLGVERSSSITDGQAQEFMVA